MRSGFTKQMARDTAAYPFDKLTQRTGALGRRARRVYREEPDVMADALMALEVYIRYGAEYAAADIARKLYRAAKELKRREEQAASLASGKAPARSPTVENPVD